MELQCLAGEFSVCKLAGAPKAQNTPFFFYAQTDEEYSLVCPSAKVPENTLAVTPGWRAFRIVGVLDFSLVGIIARIAQLLAEREISVFVVSTYNTDYVFLKMEQFDNACAVLKENGYVFQSNGIIS